MKLYRAAIYAWLAWDAAGFFNWLADRPWYARTLTDWVDVLPLAAGNRGLEVGCGPGVLTDHVQQRGVAMTGLDKSAAMIDRARHDKPDCTFIKGDALALPLEDDCMDIAFAASVINVVPTPEKLVAEMARVVRTGGHVAVLFPTPRLVQGAASIAEKQKLTDLSRAALLFWGSKAKKLEPSAVVVHFTTAGLVDVRIDLIFDDTLASVTGRVA